jgi:phosphotransferase system HPr-like phosphotransfer protein
MKTVSDKGKKEAQDRREVSAAPPFRRSLHKIISEDAFKEPLKERARPFFRIASLIIKNPSMFSAFFYYNVVSEVEKLQNFLHDYGAAENKAWHHFSELISSIRNFSVAAFELCHLINRYGDYFADEKDDFAEEFISHAFEAVDFINHVEIGLVSEALEELKRQGCDPGDMGDISYSFGEIGQEFKLPRNIDLEQHATSESWARRIAETYRKLALKIHRDRYGSRPGPEELAEIIPSRFNETKVKVLENSLHGIQSEYDTHIRQTEIERRNPELLELRACIAIPMHLLEMARWNIHFYERHENEAHVYESQKKISEIVDKNSVLKLLSHFAFYYAHKYIMKGKPIAEKVMSKFVKKGEIELPIPQPAGFHARPAYYVTLVVEEHGTDVFLKVANRKFDARSVLDLLEAGGLAADEGLETVIFTGDARTLADLKILADHNYCEDEKVPKELNYIRVARNIMT